MVYRALALAVTAMLASGCAGSSSRGPSEPDLPPHESLLVRLSSASMLVVLDGVEGSTVRVRQDEMQQEAAQAECTPTQSGKEFFWVEIWNRTGLASYHQLTINWSRPGSNDIIATLPQDPPFLVWPGMTCSGEAFVSFHADRWFWSSSRVDPGAQVDTPRLAERAFMAVDVKVAPGSLEGEAIFPVLGDVFFIEFGLAGGDVSPVSGQPLGDLEVYEPSTSCTHDPHWIRWTHRGILNSTWIRYSDEHGMPGNYRIRLALAAPSTSETVWRAEAQVWKFLPTVVDFGFAAPFVFDESRVCRSAV